MDEILGGLLRGAVWERIDLLNDLADTADGQALATATHGELPRLIGFWRDLLAEHEPDARGTCPRCSTPWRSVDVPCDTWRLAHEHLCAKRPRPVADRVIPRPTLSMPSRTALTPGAAAVTPGHGHGAAVRVP